MQAAFLLINVLFGIICASVAARKGRSSVGWFFIGFFITWIGLIIACVVSDLNKEQEIRVRASAERRRLREQLRQERMKNEAFRHYTAGRLDAHDRELGVDTRAAGPELGGGAPAGYIAGPGAAPGSGSGRGSDPADISSARTRAAGHSSAPGKAGTERQWYYEMNGQQRGPAPESVVRDMLQSGGIGPNTLLWTEGIDEWTPARRISTFRTLGRS